MDEQVAEAIESLVQLEDDALLDELALRARALATDFELGGQLNPEIPEPDHFGAGDDLRELGVRIWTRVEREMHDLICGSAKVDEEDRARIRSAVGMNDAVLAGALVYVLTGSFGLAPAVAAVVAALLLKRVFKPAGAELCSFWAEKIAARKQ